MTTDLSETSRWKWDVFLSFRGEDTRYKFTDHLYHSLRRKYVRVFRDAEAIPPGDEISPTLDEAIEGSRISVVIFSKDYASSDSCLDELVTILKCKEEKQHIVFPIFYEIDPSQMSNQGMDVHEHMYGKGSEKVKNWRLAMEKASQLKGETYVAGYEGEFIEKIVKKILSFLGPRRLFVAANPVGLESRIQELVFLMESICSNKNEVQMFGIYGISGIGKTTIAKAFYNLVAEQFESACFIDEVRVKASAIDGMVRIQETILASVIGKEDIKLKNIHEGIVDMQKRLRDKKILLILDDADELPQLDVLAGNCNWFGPGSRVIIVTRHQDLFRQHGIKKERTYELTQLDHHKALELFCWHAFKKNAPEPDYVRLSEDLTKYAQGLPLALQIIGSDLYGKEKDEWESTLAEHKSIMSDDIFTRLKVSYDKLRYNVKQMFLDMACFFNRESSDYLEKVFDGCKFHPKSGMSVLEDKCFIRRQDGKVWMHDLVEKMGREIVRQESEAESGKRSRLWHSKDVLEVLNRNSGTSAILGLMLELPEKRVVDWNDKCFKKMINLRILIIRKARFSPPPKHLPNSLIVLHWEDYPSSSFPSNFVGSELLDLRLENASHPFHLDYPLKKYSNMKYLSITRCDHVTEVPDLSCAKHMVEIHLDFCRNLVELGHDNGSISLPGLKVFSVAGCSKLIAVPRIVSEVLKTVNLSGCCQIEYVPPMPSGVLQELYLQGSGKYVAWSFYSNEQKNCPVVFVPGDSIPIFFQCRRAGWSSLSFRVRSRVPTICVGFALERTECNSQLSYQISLSLGDSLQLVRKGDFIQNNTCRVFFCNMTNALSEEEKVLQEEWVSAQVSGTVTYSDTLKRLHRDAAFVRIIECGVFVNSSDVDFKNYVPTEADPVCMYLWYQKFVRADRLRMRQEDDVSESGVFQYVKRQCLSFREFGASRIEDDAFGPFTTQKNDVWGRSRIKIWINKWQDTVSCAFNYVGDGNDNYGFSSEGSRTVASKLIVEEVALHDVGDDGSHHRSKARMALHLPTRGWVKLNIVESNDLHPHTVAWGVVARDWTGGWLVAFHLDRPSNIFRTIKNVLEWAQSRHLQNVIVESDSHETIDRLHPEKVYTSRFYSSDDVTECRDLLSRAGEVRVQHKPLEPEQVAKVLTAVPMIAALGACPSDGVPYYVLDMVLREFSCLQ